MNELNGLLKGEISACETYRQALDKIECSDARKILEANHSCHTGQVTPLQNAVRELGGEPAEGSGVWGAFAKLLAGGATVPSFCMAAFDPQSGILRATCRYA